MVALAEHCPGLTSVDLRYCGRLTDAAVMALAEHCSGLSSVDLECCSYPTDVTVGALAEHCSGLALANPGKSEDLTDAA